VPNKTKLHLKIIITAIVVAGVFGYAYSRMRNLIEGPQIVITAPENGRTVDSSLINIRGETRNITSISLNGRTIFTDEDGHIQERVLLSYGYNVLEFRAQDRFGREIKKVLELVYK